MPLKEGSQELNSDIYKPIQKVVKILPKLDWIFKRIFTDRFHKNVVFGNKCFPFKI